MGIEGEDDFWESVLVADKLSGFPIKSGMDVGDDDDTTSGNRGL